MAITAAARTELITLVVGMFGAAPGANVLDSLTTEIENGATLANLSNALTQTTVFQGLYPLHLTNGEFATQFINNILEEASSTVRAEVATLATGLLNGGTSRGDLILQALTYLSTVSSTDTVLGSSAAALANKVDVATYYSVTQNLSGASLAALQSVINTVTSSASTVTTAYAAIEALVSTVLTTGEDHYVGTNLNNFVLGTFGDGTATFTVGDTLDGKGGIDTLRLTTTGVGASAAVSVSNFEVINITDTFGATLNASAILNAPAINFTTTGVTSTVTGASLSSTYGLTGTGDLTIDFATTTGSADTAKLYVNNASAADINVSDGNTIEAVTIATSGTNNVTLVAGTKAATVSITGNGTNTFDLSAGGSVAEILTLDASASTGTNTFTMGSTLQTTDTIKGGSGADTVSAQFLGATLVKPTMTGVETLKADFDAAAIFNLANTTGLTAISLAGSSADATFTNVASTVTSLTSSTVAAGKDINLSYLVGAGALLTTTLGTTAATTYDEINLVNTKGLTLKTAGTGGVTVTNGIDLNGDQSIVSVTASASLDLGTGIDIANGDVGSVSVTVANSVANADINIDAEDGSVGAITAAIGNSVANADIFVGGVEGTGGNITIAIGTDSSVSAGVAFEEGDIGNITLTAGDGSYVESYFNTDNGSVGNINVTSDNAEINFAVGVSGGDIGNVNFSITGEDASGSYLGLIASGGSIGDITISISDAANMYLGVSANATYDDAFDGAGGNIGNISVTIGDDSYISGNIEADGGDIGNIAINAEGFDASGNLNIEAKWQSGDTDDDKSADDYVRGGNIGNITLNITGESSSFDLNVFANGGNIGNSVFNVTGEDASGSMYLTATKAGTGGAGGHIGTVNISVAESAAAYAELKAAVSIGLTTVSIGDDADLDLLFATAIGDAAGVVATIGDDSSFDLTVSGFDGDMGNITVTAGDDFSGNFDFISGTGDVGNVSITVGDDAHINLRVAYYTESSEFGLITINAADDANIDFNLSGGNDGLEMAGISLTLGRDAVVDFDLNSAGDFGDITINADQGFDGNFQFDSLSGDFGDITVELGDDSQFFMSFSGSVGSSFGTVTFIGGDSASSAGLWITAASGNSYDTIDGVDASDWAGALGLNLSAFSTGTTIVLGTGGSYVVGTDGADNIFLGAGSDTVAITGTGADTLFGFKAGAGNDVLAVANAANYTAYTTNTADTLASGDLTVLTDIAGGQDITTAAGLLAALNGGEYASIDATAGVGSYTFVTAASSSATTFFVFRAVETADANFDSVTLVGIVNTSTAFSALVAGNFEGLV